MPYADPIIRKEYQKKYRERNKKKRRYLWKRWYQENKIKHSEYNKKWYQQNKERLKKEAKEYYYIHKERISKHNRQWGKRNKKYISEYKKKNYPRDSKKAEKNRQEHLKTWEGYIPKKTECQICDRKIYFNQGTKGDAIHFDHKNDNILIKNSPKAWLKHHFRTFENQKIWEECAFGMLCHRCNSYLPTKDREQFVKNIVKYVFGGINVV